jgi:YNFM family putative membrane transporter
VNWSYRNTVLVSCTAAFFATVTARLVISPVVPDIETTLGVSTGRVGLALSGMWAMYAISQFPSGILGDRFGERRVVLAAVGGTAAASALLALAPTFAFFALFAVVLGGAAGLHYSAATALLTRQFEQTGRAIGIHVSGAPLAGLLAPPVAAIIGAQYGWRPAVLLGTAVGIPIVIVFWFRVRPTEPRVPDARIRDRLDLGLLFQLLARPPITYTIVLAALGAFTWQATASFLPVFLERGYGLSRTTAGLLFSMYFLISGALQPVVGTLSDRFSRDLAAAITMTFGVVGYAVLAVGDGIPLAVAGVACVGAAMTWGAPLQSRFMDVLGASEKGIGFGLVRTVYMLVGASGSVVVGTAADVFGWKIAFALLSGVTATVLTVIVLNRLLSLGW